MVVGVTRGKESVCPGRPRRLNAIGVALVFINVLIISIY